MFCLYYVSSNLNVNSICKEVLINFSCGALFSIYRRYTTFSFMVNIVCLEYVVNLFNVIRWEEEKRPDGVKWTFLEHKGPVFAPPYEPLPKSVKFFYDGMYNFMKDLLLEFPFFLSKHFCSPY